MMYEDGEVCKEDNVAFGGEGEHPLPYVMTRTYTSFVGELNGNQHLSSLLYFFFLNAIFLKVGFK